MFLISSEEFAVYCMLRKMYTQLLLEGMMSDKVSKSAVTVRDSAGVIDLTPSHYLLCRLPPPTLVTALPLGGGDWGVPKIFVPPPPAPKCQILSEHFFGILFYSMQSKFVPFFLGRAFFSFLRLGLCLGDPWCHSCWSQDSRETGSHTRPRVRGSTVSPHFTVSPPMPPSPPNTPLPLIPRQMVQSR